MSDFPQNRSKIPGIHNQSNAMNTVNRTDSRPSSFPPFPLALTMGAAVLFSAGLSPRAAAIIPFNESGSGVLGFGSLPPNADWATMTWAGAAADITDAAGLDAAVQTLDIVNIATTLGSSSTVPPSASGLARFNSTLQRLQFYPTAGVKGNVLVAKMENYSDAAISQVEISYDFAKPVAGTEDVPGLRVYYSLTGLPDSWVLVPELSTGTPGKLSAGFVLGSSWEINAPLYVLWADDSSAAGDAYTIDNVNFRKAGEEAKILSFGSPGNDATLSGTDIRWYVPDGTDVTTLAPTFNLSYGASSVPVSGSTQDFTNPVQYTVTGQNPLVSQTYTVTVATGTPTVSVPGNWGAAYSDPNHNLNQIVGSGNRGRLAGDFIIHWSGGTGSFTVPIDTNGFIFYADSGGGNSGHVASGPLSGDGALHFRHGPHANAGTWNVNYTVGGSEPNTYTGGTWIRRGQIRLAKSSGVDAFPKGTVTLGSSNETARLVWGASDQINDLADVIVLTPTVSNGATPDANLNYLDLQGSIERIKSLELTDDGTKTQVRTGTGGVLNVDTLTVNGVPMPRGAYAAGSGFVTGTGYIDVDDFGPPVIEEAPDAPVNPTPADLDATINLISFTKLDWADSPGATSYDVYFWPSTETKPEFATASSLPLSEFAPFGQLESLTTYKWQVIARNDVGETSSPEWTFTTLDRRDITGLQTLVLDQVVGAGPARLTGDATTHWGTMTSNVDVNLNGFQFTIDSGGGNPQTYNGSIYGPGTLRFRGRPDGTWTPDIQVGGTVANSPDSVTFNFGLVQLNKTPGVDALAGPITVASTNNVRIQWLADDQINDASSIDSTSSSGGLKLELAGFSDSIGALTLKAGHMVDTGDGGVLTVSALMVDNVELTGGPYTNATNPEFVTGTGSIVVGEGGGGSGFSDWATAKGLAGGNAAFDADPDGDGLTNGIEFVLGGEPNPANPGSNSTGLLPTGEIDGSDFVISFTRTNESAYLNPVIEFDTDLQGTWTTAVDPGNATIEVAPGSPSATITVRIPMGSNTSMFGRMKVLEP